MTSNPRQTNEPYEPHREALGIALRALAWYEDDRHWDADDWGVVAVVKSPEYGNPGQKARNARRRIEALLRKVDA